MARTRVRWSRVAALAAVAAMATGVAGRAALAGGPNSVEDQAPRTPAAHVYVVREGDTLWSIASARVGPTGDPRPLVDAIARRNLVTGVIVPGERLLIPSF